MISRVSFSAAAVVAIACLSDSGCHALQTTFDPSRAASCPDCPDAPPPTPRRRPPNILLLLTDDQDVLLGGLDHMPILRRELIERGTYFENAFVHTPICCPSRSSILSGRYLHNGGALNNSVSGNCNGPEWQNDAERETFAVYAQNAGYVTSYAGKYLNRYGNVGSPGCPWGGHAGCDRVPPGWDRWFGLVGNSRYYNYDVVRSDDGGTSTQRFGHGQRYDLDYFPDLVANRTLDMIDDFISKDPDRPFLAVAAWPTPHGPFTPAPWAEHLYDGATAPRTENWNATSDYMRTKHWLMRRLAPIDTETEDWIDNTYELRLEALRSVDEHIGEMVDLLRRRRVLEDTVVIYTSDNGFQLGQHRLRGDKRQLYEHDIRVPFVVTGPRVPRNVKTNQIVLNVDIAPTIYELVTGSDAPLPNTDGISFAPYLNGNDVGLRPRTDFLVSYHGEGNPQCGMAECPPVPPSEYHGGNMPDAFNNTYHCVRTIETASGYPRDDEDRRMRGNAVAAAATIDTIYCRFEDSENFTEYYDLAMDKWELVNQYQELSDEERKSYDSRLAQLRECKGDSCRSLPSDSHGEYSDRLGAGVGLEAIG